MSRIQYGKKTVKVFRLDDPKVGFGRRKSPSPGHPRITGQSRKVTPHVLQTTRGPEATGNASEMVAKKARERMELRQKIRELTQAGRSPSALASARVAPRKASPRQTTSTDEAQASSVAAVIRVVSGIEDEAAASKSGPPGEPGNTFDENFDCKQ